MDLGIWGDHAYSNVEALGRRFSPPNAFIKCHGEGFTRVPVSDDRKASLPFPVEVHRCSNARLGVPSKIGGALGGGRSPNDMFAVVDEGFVIAYYFVAEKETELDAQNAAQSMLNFRRRSADCEVYDESIDMHRCFEIYSQVRSKGKKVYLIHGMDPISADIAYELAFGDVQNSRQLTEAEKARIMKCRPLTLDCKL
ncbi:hypothetical protein FIV42_15805 [Persicimonas caeni]|uniref:Uncharacterized protein n=2 Tax=Persicimonas caeni TaxID=2292766 RepID=A0A4Y6PUX2_PERCE|nr:hypothetical protein FIV42_15805 [Persicimonas caeni]QED33376.1 hypothetical protein FRD00_15800 [Persicimonas caeni]